MDLLYGKGDRFAVVDVETTGVYNRDRVVEVAAVTVFPHGQIIDEWDTLVNPERDVGPTHIHRVSASMVSAAPTFAEVAAALAERLNGAVLVAHNLTFDCRMLVSEYRRVDGELDPGSGIYTLRLFGEKLEDACRHRGIPLDYPHRALADARATARLLRSDALGVDGGSHPASVELSAVAFRPRTLRRDMDMEADDQMPYLARLADRAHHYGVHESALVYMDLLDWALSDLDITRAEEAQLTELAIDVGLTRAEVVQIHHRYLDELIEAALRDEVIQPNEMRVLEGVAEALNVDSGYASSRVRDRMEITHSVEIRPGMRVCFTGSATATDGSPLARDLLSRIAGDLELEAVDRLTKKGCDLLVAADPASQSGKAHKARSYGIPIVSVDDFLLAQPNSTLRTT